MFAVIKTGGKQYRVAENDILKVERLAGDTGDMVELTEVLMVSDGDKSTLGAPNIADALVTAEIVEHLRSRKVLSFKKRRRQNSKRIRGHRQMLTAIRISEILTGGAKPKKAAAARKPVAKTEAPEAKTEAPKKEAKPAAKAEAKPEAKAEAKAEKPAAKAPAKTADKAEKTASAASKAKTAAKPAAAQKPAAQKPAAKKPAAKPKK